MSEKRKDHEMREYQCNACGIRICTAEYQDGCGVPFKCTYITDGYSKPQWKEIERGVANLPKLTAEVFDRPDCPKWAEYAAVCADGSVRVFLNNPSRHARMYWYDPNSWWEQQLRNVKYDASDWRNSLVKRSDKKTLPDWCKVGEWAYCKGRYKKIEAIDRTHRAIDMGFAGTFIPITECAEARLRPYNAAEMQGLVGKVLKSRSSSNPFSFLVVYAEGNGRFIASHRFDYTAKELKDFFTIEGKPCGVLEHLVDGEWVK